MTLKEIEQSVTTSGKSCMGQTGVEQNSIDAVRRYTKQNKIQKNTRNERKCKGKKLSNTENREERKQPKFLY